MDRCHDNLGKKDRTSHGAAHAHANHDAHAASQESDTHTGHHTQDFLNKFWVKLVLTFPIVLYSDLPQLFLNITAPAFPGSAYLPLILGSVVFWYGGLVFLKGALHELKAKLPGMMTLIALAILAAYAYSVGSFFFGDGTTLFWELSTLILVMLLGHYVEMKAVMSAKGALHELAKLLPDTAEVIRDGNIVAIQLSALGAALLSRINIVWCVCVEQRVSGAACGVHVTDR